MLRRDLLKMTVLAGASLALSRRASAETPTYGGPFLLTIHASGGWDTTLFLNGIAPSSSAQQNLYSAPAKKNGFTYAPINLMDGTTTLDTVSSFIQDLGPRLVAINGIDTQTNNHSTGVMHTWSGKPFQELPSLAALLAAKVSATQRLPLAFISQGGYEVTGNLVPLTRIADPNLLRNIALPDIVNPRDPVANRRRWQPPQVVSALESAKEARLQRLLARTQTAAEKDALQQLAAARANGAGFDRFSSSLPPTIIDSTTAFPSLGYNDASLTRYLRAAEVALAAFASGQAVSANLTVGAFDTHDNHDLRQTRELGRLCLLLRFVFRRLEELGLSNKVNLVVGSEFGRTPTYNAQGGKDHWNVTSMLFAGPGLSGGRTLGGTDEKLRPLPVSVSDPRKVLAFDDPSGTRINPAHIHRALRKRLGLDSEPAFGPYNLPVARPLDDLLS